MADVFVSYSSTDRALVERLAAALQQEGFSLWWDREILGGEKFERVIEREIRDARCVLVLWTAKSVDSDWVRSEAMHGFDRGVLLPVVAHRAEVPLPFSTLNNITLAGATLAGDSLATGSPEFQRLCTSLRAIVSGEQRMGLRHQQQQAPTEPQASLAVLPLRSMTNSDDDQALCVGISFGLVAALSRVPELFVIDFNSSLNMASSPRGARHLAEELAVRYVVQGQLMRMGKRLRVMVEVVEAVTSRQLWSETLDVQHDLDDLFALQDSLCNSIAARLSPRLQTAERERSTRKPTADLAAWELVNQARPLKVRSEDEAVRLAMLDRAIALDPDYVEALALRARHLSFRIVMGQTQVTDEVMSALDHALRLDPDNEYALVEAATCHFHLRNWDEAYASCERALAINPNMANAWALFGLCTLAKFQDGASALKQIQRAFELSPKDDQAWLWHHEMASCHLELGDFAAAAQASKLSVQAWDGWFFTWICYAQHLVLAEDLVAARKAWQKAKKLMPRLNIPLYLQLLQHAPQRRAVTDLLAEKMPAAGLD